jgi:FKBP-type peptidyl-prolyl cis-trans isomerase
VRSVDTLQKKGQVAYNEVFKKGGTINGKLVIVEAYPDQQSINADQAVEAEKETAREIAALEAYLKSKNIGKYTKQGKGVYVVVDQQGNGIAADSGDNVKVNYTGYLKDGKKFDSNVDTAFHHTDPFTFTLGTGAVIPGWDEGLRQMKQGTKARLFIPAMLAYGPQGQGDRMPPFSDLIFEVELLEVTKATASPAPAPGPAPAGH